MSASKPRLAEVITFRSKESLELAKAFREIADVMERGQITGAGFTLITIDGETIEGALGTAKTNRAVAHLGACRLSRMLLWPEGWEP